MPNLEEALKNPFKYCIKYKNEEFTKNNPDVSAHYYVIIPLRNNTLLLLGVITSSKYIDQFLYDTSYMASVVPIKENEFEVITKDCYIDCNFTEFHTIEKFKGNSYQIHYNNIPLDFMKLICNAVRKSDYTSNKVRKNLLSNSELDKLYQDTK